MKYVFEITPVAQGRPKFTRRGHAYDPPKSRKFKRELASIAKEQLNEYPFYAGEHVPIEVHLKFYVPMLKSFSKIKRERALNGSLRPPKRPDIDNYIKGTLDSLNNLFWHDDGQIVEIHAGKYYSDTPRIELEIKEVADG